MKTTFIDPYPERLLGLLRPEDHDRAEIRVEPVQAVDLAVFDVLGPGDVLFIDSTHVARTGGDVVHDVFTILPRLASGVRVHFHDMFYPFEYPAAWVFEGRAWNEAVPDPRPALRQHALQDRAVAVDALGPAHRPAGGGAPDRHALRRREPVARSTMTLR